MHYDWNGRRAEVPDHDPNDTPCPEGMSIETHRHLHAVFESERERTAATLDDYAGRAIGHMSPDTGFYLDFVTRDDSRGSHSGMLSHRPIIAMCLERSIPVLDHRPMTLDDRLRVLFRGPVLAVGKYDFEQAAFRSGPLSYLPTAAYCALWVEAGAVLHGEPYDLRLASLPFPPPSREE